MAEIQNTVIKMSSPQEKSSSQNSPDHHGCCFITLYIPGVAIDDECRKFCSYAKSPDVHIMQIQHIDLCGVFICQMVIQFRVPNFYFSITAFDIHQ